ncbi:hypothetical protein, partial [Streptomyces sp. SID8499]|uniref:hypothetical protein n=1 Tax=Streptomyces sp. SID8499 TaxID=2706106 RepID=UPI0019443819
GRRPETAAGPDRAAGVDTATGVDTVTGGVDTVTRPGTAKEHGAGGPADPEGAGARDARQQGEAFRGR